MNIISLVVGDAGVLRRGIEHEQPPGAKPRAAQDPADVKNVFPTHQVYDVPTHRERQRRSHGTTCMRKKP